MVKETKSKSPDEGGSKTDDRRARQAAALRENLRKRKQQSRARAAGSPKEPTGRENPDA